MNKLCRVCLVEHDEDIHAATLRVREWFRDWVLMFSRKTPMPRENANKNPKRWEDLAL